MPETGGFPLRIVDGRRLEKSYRDALTPGDVVCDMAGAARQLPRYFYEVPSWDVAQRVQLTSNFSLWEFITTDVREAEPLRFFPRYVPCAITLLAAALERLRQATGTYVHIAANGGYRSPGHVISCNATPHCWGTAANIYRVGDTWLDTRESIERYGAIAREAIPGAWVRPFGTTPGCTDDHLHVDIGYVLSVPREAPIEPWYPKLDSDPL